MEEKKLTDEEIVKDLEIGSKSCEPNYLDCLEYWELVRVCQNALDLIHRLQDEKSEQKAEIERLTEKSSYQRLELCKEIAALKKQVDEWTNTASKWFKRELELMDEVERAKGKTVKEAAQEALETFICRLVNSRLVSTKDDLYVELLETKDDLLKEKYGVEVE